MTPVTDPDLLAQLNAPVRAEVPSTAKVWGDKEAEANGVYEPSGKPVTDPNLLRQLNGGAPRRPGITITPFNERFQQPPQTGGQPMQEGLNRRGLEQTRGPELSPSAQMAGELANLAPAASQGTIPHVANYGGQLVSTEVFEDDGGNVLYRDPETKQIKPTNKDTQVAIRDPADGRVKIFNRSEATDENPAVGVARVLAPGLAAGAVTARPAIAAAPTAVTKASDVFATAKPHYRAFEAEAAKSAPISGNEAKVMIDRVQNALDVAHLPVEVAKQVHDTVALIGKHGETGLQQLQYVKRAVGNLFKSADENVRNGAGVASKEINRMIAELSPSAGKSLKTADDIHSTARSMQDLQRRQDIAGLRTSRAGYGGNAVNNMRTQIEQIVESAVKGRTTGFKPHEIQAMREIVDGNWLTNAARIGGAMAPSKGILQIGTGIGTAGITAALGSASNKLAAILTGKQIERLNELVAKRSPEYAQAVAKATEHYEKAQMEFVNNPSPNKLAAYLSASRALSAGLTRDGIPVASGDLLKAIQGPVKTAAEGDEPAVPGRPGQ